MFEILGTLAVIALFVAAGVACSPFDKDGKAPPGY